MITDVTLPKLGLTMEEGEVEEWLKSVGDQVERGEEIVTVATDKISTEIEAPATGVLIEIVAAVGDELVVGDVLARIES